MTLLLLPILQVVAMGRKLEAKMMSVKLWRAQQGLNNLLEEATLIGYHKKMTVLYAQFKAGL